MTERSLVLNEIGGIIGVLRYFKLKAACSGEQEAFDRRVFTDLISSLQKLKRREGGERGHPCLTPLSRKTGVESLPLQIIREKTFE